MKKKNNIDYQYIIGADIETSRVRPDGGNPDGSEDIQVPFLTNTLEMDIESGKFTQSTFHRTIKEWIWYLNSISSEERMRIVYCHNLFYEMTFIIRQFNASFVQMDDEEVNAYGLPSVDGIMRNTTDVVYARLDCCPNIIFRDSLALFNKTLKGMGEDLAKRLQNNDYLKLEYDYDEVRLPWDELTEHDYKYNERDNEVTLMSLYFFLQDRGITMEECPLTSTADTKRARKEFIVEQYGEKHLKQINRNKQYVINMYEFYSLLRGTYQGGFTGANYKYIDKLIKDVYSVDIKSSYPYQMVSNIFPVYHEDTTSHFSGDEANDFYFDYLHGINHAKLQKVSNRSGIKGYYALVEFEKVKILNDRYLLDLSNAHCFDPALNNLIDTNTKDGYENNKVLINGKIKEIDRVVIMMNNVDLDRFLMLYDYDNLIVRELWVTTMSRRLPEGEIGFILNNFSIKESIDKNKEPIQYTLAKIRINAMYGVKVQNEVKDFTNIQNGVISKIEFSRLEPCKYENVKLTKETVYENTIGNGNKRTGFKGYNFDIYSDGVYITSFARTMLMNMMVKLTEAGFDVVYSDTDSLKFKANKTKNKTTNKIKKTNKKDIKSDNLNVHNKVNKLISEVNNNIIKSNMENHRIQQFLLKNQIFNENKLYALGTWEIESINENKEIQPYSFFKTLGAKKYAYIDDKGIHTTVAGCRKETFAKAISTYASKTKQSLSTALDYLFTPGTLVEASASGRTTARYEKRSFDECSQLTYQGRLIDSAGGVIIEPTTYTLNISKNDSLVMGEVERFEYWIKSINIDGYIEYNEEDLEAV